MANYICKYCKGSTSSPELICWSCREKLELIRKIKAMLKPSYDIKKELERRGIWQSSTAEAEQSLTAEQ